MGPLIVPLMGKPTTNLLLRSQELDQSPWAQFTATVAVTANFSTAPDGSDTGDKVSFTGATALWSQPITRAIVPGETFTLSGWVRNVNGSVALRIFRLGAGTNESGALVLPAGASWRRLSLTYTFANAQTGLRADLYCADASGDVEAWGLQMERSESMGPYVPTTTAAATRYS